MQNFCLFYPKKKIYFFHFTHSFLQNTHISLCILHIYSIKYSFFYIFYYFLTHYPSLFHKPNATQNEEKSQNATNEIKQNPKHMQATSNLNRQAKSKSQNPLIKQRKIEEVKPPQRWQWQAKSVLASERASARVRSDRASAWVWRGLRWGWDSRGLQVGLGFPFDMLGLILGLISIDFCWFWLWFSIEFVIGFLCVVKWWWGVVFVEWWWADGWSAVQMKRERVRWRRKRREKKKG